MHMYDIMHTFLIIKKSKQLGINVDFENLFNFIDTKTKALIFWDLLVRKFDLSDLPEY